MKRSELFFASIQIPVDIVMIITAFVLAYYIRIDLEVVPAFSDIGLREYLRYSLYLMPAWIILLGLNDLYGIGNTRSFWKELYRIFSASSTAMLILIVAIFLSRSLFFSRLILIFTWGLSVFTLAFGRLLIRAIRSYLFRFKIGVSNTLVIGDNGSAEKIIQFISRDKNCGYNICGILTIDGRPSKNGLKVLGALDELGDVMTKYQVDDVIVTDGSIRKSNGLDILQLCADRHASFRYVPDLLALATKNVSLGLVGSTPVMALQPIPLDGWGRVTKRILDILFSLVALLLSSPLLIFAAVGTRLTSSGPIVFKQKRVGRDGQTFDFYKFRSMYYDKCDYSEKGKKWTTKADEKSRITPFGLLLRKTNIDELPQFFNVLFGTMSFVGPRPELPKFVEQFQKEIPEYFRRHRVKSGITGWAQVNGLKGDTSIKERVKYDTYYIENWSVLFDLMIILKTVGLVFSEVFGGKTEYRAPETIQPSGTEVKESVTESVETK
ncbi:MAG: undecaprenyl-phosphate glucose phosphotransferase [Patescibacteria group bacterium]|jgi:exopolysaccharide biosynthesis polyprenyl glycosylphosphotransferase